MSNVFLVYGRVKKSTTSQEEVNETLIKFGDILRVKKDDSFFDKADSLQSNTEELYELYYSPSESAYANFADLRKKLDFDYGKNTTAKGNALEKKDRFNRSFFLARIFSYYKGNRTLEII